MKRMLLGGLLAAAALAVSAGSYTCQIDGNEMYFTGATRVDRPTGVLLGEFKCPMGHTFWLPQ